jgi:hypothetical protein
MARNTDFLHLKLLISMIRCIVIITAVAVISGIGYLFASGPTDHPGIRGFFPGGKVEFEA